MKYKFAKCAKNEIGLIYQKHGKSDNIDIRKRFKTSPTLTFNETYHSKGHRIHSVDKFVFLAINLRRKWHSVFRLDSIEKRMKRERVKYATT